MGEPVFALRESNDTGGYYFMSIFTGKNYIATFGKNFQSLMT